jgi:DNA-binding NarL/FixJ family response regulator
MALRDILTPSETDVFDLLIKGCTTNDIALRLLKSYCTVKVQLSSIFLKSNLSYAEDIQSNVRFLQTHAFLLDKDITNIETSSIVEDLTTREKEVLMCYLLGYSPKHTASIINISNNTVSCYIALARAKLGVRMTKNANNHISNYAICDILQCITNMPDCESLVFQLRDNIERLTKRYDLIL